ncbi:4591_t:CDS:2 [Funneliformis geosporum]|uniref:1579_t:CDS:1 n=1 Tax=Funneliformis geosporum TaxID=1117311 RepID=A0A9W4SMK7_9GLOM|nr:4591_t:CDS:2 [Funneliformis geosporum]CAI2174888.1 1579_t:CDS:2 [Funneliformis geosporum]
MNKQWNDLTNAPRGLVREFVEKHKSHCNHKTLIANNGITAVKEIRSIRKLAYENLVM